MGKGLVLAYTMLFFSMLLGSAAAVAFTLTSSPSGINAGQTSQLVNFSIQNIGNVNITQVNITLPSEFVFTGVSTTTATGYTSSSSVPSWTNVSSTGVVGNGATQFFSIYVNTPSRTGSFSFNVSTLDVNAVFNSSNVTFSLFDTLAPTYSSNTTSPSNASVYSTTQNYWFNVTWTDGVGVSTVLLEHNLTGSGTPHNQTMSNSSSVYYFNVTSLPAGTYVWKVYANDTNNTFNSTNQLSYVVNQSSNELNFYLDGRLNRNTTALNNTAINITVTASCLQAGCNTTVTRDNSVTIVSGGSNPFSKTDETITSVGLHNYSVSVSGNTNYTSSSSTYFVGVTPNYTTSTSNIALTYSNTTVGLINITFNSDPSFSNLKIEGDWSGTAANYTMLNASVRHFYYNLTFPAGTTNWKIFGNYSNYTFNLTTVNSFSINKAAPNLTLSITPQWTLDSPVQTNVSCTLSRTDLTASLYRNGTSVSNPDVQTFTAGSAYEYLCNNTVNQNYTTDPAKNTLVIKAKPSVNLSFIQAPILVEIVQNSSVTSEIKVKNLGNVMQTVTLEISDMAKDWYSIDPAKVDILGGATKSFTITFNVGVVDVKNYPAKIIATSTNGTISQEFTLRVLPSAGTKLKINDTVALYRLEINKLESRLDEIKSTVNNTASIEQKLGELKSALKQAEDYINSDNYFQAQQTFETIKSLISEVENQLKTAEAPGAKVEIPSNVWLIIAGVIIVAVIGVVAFLFWPVKKGYKPETGEYVYGSAKEKRSLVETLKNFLSKFKRKKKTETAVGVI